MCAESLVELFKMEEESESLSHTAPLLLSLLRLDLPSDLSLVGVSPQDQIISVMKAEASKRGTTVG